MQLLNLTLTLILLLVFLFLNKKGVVSLNRIIKVAAVVLFFVHLFQLYVDHAIDGSFNLLLIDINTNLDAPTTWLFGVGKSIFLIFLRWFTILVTTWIIIGSFYSKKTIHTIIAFLGPILFILNIVFFRDLLTAYLGDITEIGLRGWMYWFEIALFGTISILYLYNFILQKMKLTKKEIGIILLIVIFSSFAIMPQSILYNLFGLYGEVPDEFVGSHLAVIFFPFVLMSIIYALMRTKDQQSKDLLIKFMTIAAFFQYFYLPRTGLGALPLHLCNAAIILMMYSVLFKKQGVFYFSYFANVVGALAAIILPNYSTDFNVIETIHFGYNHLYAFIIPILAVSLHTFPRPVLKHMYQAIGVFVVYFIVVVVLNAWFNNYQSGVDYFFTYSDFLSDMFGVRELQFDYYIDIEVSETIILRFFYIFQPLYFVGFIFLMFMSWFIYDSFYQMFDRHFALRDRQKQMKYERDILRTRLEGRSEEEPINPKGVDMIKITNFSKKYGKSSKKAVDNFSLEVHKGEVFGFLGHNGAGKSTTIKSLVGIQSITEGEMEICGYSIKTQPLQAKLKMGYVSDNHAVYEKLTGREYINYVADLYDVPYELRKERLEKYLEQFNLSHAIDQEVKSYSHGMKQKLVVIASLIHEPEVWILDEPLTGLDPTSAYQIKESMKEHAEKGNIVFFSSHVIEVVEKICTRIAIINSGKLQGIYNMEDLRREGVSLEELYMRNVKPSSTDKG